MYQALYRKWRPRTFDDVVGQDHITGTLKKQVQNDRLSRAYLFIGTKFLEGPLYVGLSYPAGWLLSSTLMYIVYKRGSWEKNIITR